MPDENRLSTSPLNEDFNGDGAVSSYLRKKEKNHETDHNRTSNCLHSNEHIRVGAIARSGWVRNSHGSFGGFVPAASGYDKCSPHLEEHWPRSQQRPRPIRLAFRKALKMAQAGFASLFESVTPAARLLCLVADTVSQCCHGDFAG
jgi:hypothetical protein